MGCTVSDDAQQVRKDFDQAVNMTAPQLKKWLDSDESKQVGQKKGGTESTGHRSGRRIVTLLGTNAHDLSDDHLKHMTKVVG
jgi:hypothetical protein